MTRLINHNPPHLQIPAGYITVREAAARLRCSHNTIRKYILRGVLFTGNLPGSKRAVITEAAFERFCRRRGDRRAEWRLCE